VTSRVVADAELYVTGEVSITLGAFAVSHDHVAPPSVVRPMVSFSPTTIHLVALIIDTDRSFTAGSPTVLVDHVGPTVVPLTPPAFGVEKPT